jgi:hypothetical protein
LVTTLTELIAIAAAASTGSSNSNTIALIPSTRRRSAVWNFGRHYLEMVLAMVVGMVVLGPLWSWLSGVLGVGAVLDRPDVSALVMATDMTLAMAAWMRYRGHGWAPVAEMAAAMYLPFVVLLVPMWTGAVSGHTLMTAGHALMLPAMAVAMLLRLGEYTQAHTVRPGWLARTGRESVRRPARMPCRRPEPAMLTATTRGRSSSDRRPDLRKRGSPELAAASPCVRGDRVVPLPLDVVVTRLWFST